jgi:uncharacterized protein (TIGR00661 family)
MAKILYSLAGEGSGHSTRSKEIISHLVEKKHDVKVVSYDRGYKNLKDFFDVTEITGLNFVYKNNEVKQIPTVFKNVLRTKKLLASFVRVEKLVKKFKPQMIISDFEPITARVAVFNKIPFISIDNQHFISGTRIEYPKKYKKDALITKAVIEQMTLGAKAYLSITFVPEKIIKKNIFLFPPILRKEVLEAKTGIQDYIIIYLTSPFSGFIETLKKIKKKFIVYGFDEDKIDGNIIFKKASQDGFLKDLSNCEGVIANAGFSLMSEALYLGKPYLAIPVKGQFEQVINGYYLEKFGYGKYWDDLDREKIEAFLFNLELYRENLKKYPKEDNSKIFREVDELIEKYVK